MTTFEAYCPHCDEDTEQCETMDEVFGHAIECLVCGTIWEADINEMNEEEEEEE